MQNKTSLDFQQLFLSKEYVKWKDIIQSSVLLNSNTGKNIEKMQKTKMKYSTMLLRSQNWITIFIDVSVAAS